MIVQVIKIGTIISVPKSQQSKLIQSNYVMSLTHFLFELTHVALQDVTASLALNIQHMHFALCTLSQYTTLINAT